MKIGDIVQDRCGNRMKILSITGDIARCGKVNSKGERYKGAPPFFNELTKLKPMTEPLPPFLSEIDRLKKPLPRVIIDSKWIEKRIEDAQQLEIIRRQMCAAVNAQVSECEIPSYPPLSSEETFALGIEHGSLYSPMVYFIRKGVKAHYDELRQQSGEQTDHLKHKEQ